MLGCIDTPFAVGEANERILFIFWKPVLNCFIVLRKTRAREGGGDADFAKRRRPELKIDCQDE